jgi:hypothetical protein
MAHYLHLTDGVADLDLAVATGIGIALVDISLPNPQRVIQRTSGFPFVDGQRTVASSLADATLDYVGTIYGTSVDDVDSQLLALTRMLEQARLWEEQRVGTPVRIAFKRQGTTNTAYWLVTGVPTLPHPDQGPDNWLDVETAANSLTFSMSLTVEPVAHSNTLTTLLNAGTLTNRTIDNVLALTTAPTGDMPAPLAVTIKRTASTGSPWDHLWCALVPYTPYGAVSVWQFGGTTDATTSSGQNYSATATGTAAFTEAMELNTYALLQTMWRYPWRFFLRATVNSGNYNKLQFQAQLYHVSTSAVIAATPWATYDGSLNAWRLLDLGSIATHPDLLNRVAQTNADLAIFLWYRTIDGSSVPFRLDYLDLVPYSGMTKLTGIYLGVNDSTAYEAVAADTTGFVYPRIAPQTYTVTSAGLLKTGAQRYGALGKLPPGGNAADWSVYLAGQSTVHILSDTSAVTVKALPCYAIGLRGSG